MNRGTGDHLDGLSVRGVRVNRVTGDLLVGLRVRSMRVNRGTGDRFCWIEFQVCECEQSFECSAED